MKVIYHIVPINVEDGRISVLLDKTKNELFSITADGSVFGLDEKVVNNSCQGVYATLIMAELCQKSGYTLLPKDYYDFIQSGDKIDFYFLAQATEKKEMAGCVWLDFDKLSEVNGKDTVIKLLNQYKVDISQKTTDKVIAVDGGGVLFEWKDERFFSMMAQLFGCEVEQFDSVFLGEWCRYGLHTGSMTQHQVYEKMIDRFGFVEFERYLEKYLESVHLIEKNIEVIKKLKERYPKTEFVLTSNTNPIIESVLVKHSQVAKIFSRGFFSWRMKTVKPSVQFYQAVEKELQTGDIFLIDDSKENCIAGGRQGWAFYETGTNAPLDFDKIAVKVDDWAKEIQ